MSSALEYCALTMQRAPQNRLFARSGARACWEVAHLSYDVEAPARELDRSISIWEQTLREWEAYAQADPQDKLADLTLAIDPTESAITLMQRSPDRAEALARRGVNIFDGCRSRTRSRSKLGRRVGQGAHQAAWRLTRTGKSAEARRIADETLPVQRDQ